MASFSTLVTAATASASAAFCPWPAASAGAAAVIVKASAHATTDFMMASLPTAGIGGDLARPAGVRAPGRTRLAARVGPMRQEMAGSDRQRAWRLCLGRVPPTLPYARGAEALECTMALAGTRAGGCQGAQGMRSAPRRAATDTIVQWTRRAHWCLIRHQTGNLIEESM